MSSEGKPVTRRTFRKVCGELITKSGLEPFSPFSLGASAFFLPINELRRAILQEENPRNSFLRAGALESLAFQTAVVCVDKIGLGVVASGVIQSRTDQYSINIAEASCRGLR